MAKPTDPLELFYGNLEGLRKHMRRCKMCRTAIDKEKFSDGCPTLSMYLRNLVRDWYYTTLKERAVTMKGTGWVYPCPAPGVHGIAFTEMARRVYVTATEQTLF